MPRKGRPGKGTKRSRYEFFFSEVKWPSEEASGFIVELMRCACHIQDLQRAFGLLDPGDEDDERSLLKEIENDSLRIVLLTFSASQLREALKLFSRFMRLPIYESMRKGWPPSVTDQAGLLESCVAEFEKKTGLLHSVLKPLRDTTFHYDHRQAEEWVRSRRQSESDEKPRSYLLDLKEGTFGPGFDYDAERYSRYLAWGPSGHLLETQIEVWRLQAAFLKVVRGVSAELMHNSGIPANRPFAWILEHRYGYQSKE